MGREWTETDRQRLRTLRTDLRNTGLPEPDRHQMEEERATLLDRRPVEESYGCGPRHNMTLDDSAGRG